MDEINRAGIVTVLTIYGTVQMLSPLAEHRARQDAMSPVAVRYFQMLPYGTTPRRVATRRYRWSPSARRCTRPRRTRFTPGRSSYL